MRLAEAFVGWLIFISLVVAGILWMLWSLGKKTVGFMVELPFLALLGAALFGENLILLISTEDLPFVMNFQGVMAGLMILGELLFVTGMLFLPILRKRRRWQTCYGCEVTQ